MKAEIDSSIEKYGQDHAPPPWSVFTMPNSIGPGNMHIVQKVFEGPFEFDVIYSSSSAGNPVTCKTALDFRIQSTDSNKLNHSVKPSPRPPRVSLTASESCSLCKLHSIQKSTMSSPNQCSRT